MRSMHFLDSFAFPGIPQVFSTVSLINYKPTVLIKDVHMKALARFDFIRLEVIVAMQSSQCSLAFLCESEHQFDP